MQPEHVTGERRPATVLFVDVVGSISLAERMDPEDWAATMERAMAIMTGAVERYDGWVATHTGDGFMALFGMPTAHEDDPARAVSSALEMVAGTSGLAEQLRADDVEFQIRVGINSGEVVARETGTGVGGHESRLYGDTLNVAARMQSEAPPGGILITEETHRQVSGLIESRLVGPVTVKGKAAPVEAYEVLGRAGALRAVRGITGLRSPMVGRDAELVRLTATLAPVRAGLGRMALVIGEPGIGKSRLIGELQAVAEREGFGWVVARTVSYGRNVPQHLVADLVRALTGLPDPIESIPAVEAGERLGARLDELGADALTAADGSDLRPVLYHLLSLPTTAADTERLAHMEPLTLQVRYTEAISRLAAAVAGEKPLVMVCDDVHWADDASVNLLLPLIDRITARPILWVVASRPERDAPGWRLVGAADEVFGDALVDLRLGPLGAEDGQRLVANLLEIDSLPLETREMILARAEGNPFFTEEIIRMLIDHKAIESRDGRWVATDRAVGIEIPESLHSLLLARIDRLPDETRRVLRVAAVIGRTFPVSVLDRVMGGRA
jgi:class 3 adenylate cyclase